MPKVNPNLLRIHIINVDHGDAIVLEFPDYNGMAHFAVVDTGRPEIVYRDRLTGYLETLVDIRDMPYRIEFVCISHPHEDHYVGLGQLLDRFAPPPPHSSNILQFWDCGFRTTAKTYNKFLERIAADDRIVFVRQSAGAEYEFGNTRITILAPSLDLRNRFDTFGVDRNNASIVLKLVYKRSIAILGADAHFDSWGKVSEEFPRTTKISFFKDALVERSEGPNQLNCQLLKVAHHGSKHGTSLEYIEKMSPKHFVITCADAAWYQANKPGWGTDWPHPLTSDAIQEVQSNPEVRMSFQDGNIIYTLTGSSSIPDPQLIVDLPGSPAFRQNLDNLI